MAKTKLTLSVERDIVERAKRYSRRNHTTVSELVGRFLASLEDEDGGSTPITARLIGALAPDGSIGEYHLEETWPGKIPPHVAEMRKLYQHYVTLSYGLARGKIGWWERRAERRLRDGNFKLGLLEARAFDVYNRIERKLFPRAELSRSWIDPGHKTGTSGNKYSQASKSMTETTAG